MFVGKFYSLDLVNVIVFRVNNIYMVIMFFWRSVIKLIIQERSEGGFSESKLSLLWYLVGGEREREREFVMEGMKTLFVSIPKGKILLQ